MSALTRHYTRLASGAGAALLAAMALLAGCAVGPDYRPPTPKVAAAYAEKGPWKVAEPRDALPRGDWWTVFRDPELDRLETLAAKASPNLQAAAARRDQAFALANVSRADLLPQLSLDPSGSRTRYSGHRQVPPGVGHSAYTTDSYSLPLDLSYEVDLWGRVRRLDQSARAQAQAANALYQSALLGLQADVAQAYFNLRALAREIHVVRAGVVTRKEGLKLIRIRFSGGASGELDVLNAQTELASAENDLLALEQRRTALTHALAVLCGQLPESFEVIAEKPLVTQPPALPVGLPSDLLERRPDIAAAERTMAAVNAQIGVAKAAFFPDIRLVGSAGYNSSELDSLLHSTSSQWAFAPMISLPIFTGGRNRANYERAKAAYREAAARYQGQVLVAFQEVEDSLSALRTLAAQARVVGQAVDSARKAAALSQFRYREGLVSYLEVMDAERSALQFERLASQLEAQRYAASITLVKALGGGW